MPINAIERRFKFRVPELYCIFLQNGHFDPRQSEKYLAFTDNLWMTPEEVASYEVLDEYQAPYKSWCVPFAVSARRDEWAWRTDWMSDNEPTVVFCERGPEGYGFAPDFRGYLYRRLIQEFAGTWLLENAEDEKGKIDLLRSVNIVKPHLPKKWQDQLDALLKKPWSQNEHGVIGTISFDECDRIIESDISYTHLNERFWQEQPPDE